LTEVRADGVSPEPIPQSVVQFLGSEIESVRELETLLALRACASPVTAGALAATLRSRMGWTEQQLASLQAKGLVSTAATGAGAPCYAYAPRTAELAVVVDAVADAFARRRSTVIRLIFDDAGTM
jgi:hypothetical protein